ncbi:YvrJ family protein [Bacillus solitudinis]|uniref:YvrJ family protein n=1 Tax=Bacillus solitudinis TaxID=2014074 RepID=UPI000C23C992|nr:YvrJ family protein [Bacillus solitudinis]
METWLPMLREFGFPVVVTLYLLHRVENKLEMVNQSIQKLPDNLFQQQLIRSVEQKKSV